MTIRNMRIGQRLALGFGLVIALLMLLAALALVRIQSLSGNIGELTGSTYPLTVAANRIKADVNEVSRSMLSTLVMTDAEQVKGELAHVAEVTARIDQQLAWFNRNIHDPQGAALLKAIASLRERAGKSQNAFVELVRSDVKDEAMTKYLFSIRAQHTRLFAALDQLIEQQDKHMQAAGAQSSSQARQTAGFILGLAVAASAFSIWVAFVTTRSITLPLNRAVSVAERVAHGDLTSHIEARSRDETGQLMRALADMNASLRRMVGEVRQSTDSIATASTQIASGNLDLSTRTEQQASSLQSTAGSMGQLTEIVRRSADNARQANQLAASACEVATQGGSVVSRVVQTMGAIDQSSRKIVDIISVIDGIAFQTNILALNAAVEAARAGEQGRGFAVVAGEVRSLAQRSATAAKEIKSLISESVEKVSEGSELVQEAGSTMDGVVASVRKVSDIIGEITSASASQSDGIESINEAIRQMDHTTQQNAALVEEAAAAADSMQNQASHLAQVVSNFKLGETSALCA